MSGDFDCCPRWQQSKSPAQSDIRLAAQDGMAVTRCPIHNKPCLVDWAAGCQPITYLHGRDQDWMRTLYSPE